MSVTFEMNVKLTVREDVIQEAMEEEGLSRAMVIALIEDKLRSVAADQELGESEITVTSKDNRE